ncbi:MAG TPA: hypothetical protein VI814_09995, partial [Candidatus Limnocylindria bacterium]
GARFAQVGWLKTPSGAAPNPYNPFVFVQMTGSDGSPFQPFFYAQIAPPDSYFYQVSTDRAGNWTFYEGIPGSGNPPTVLSSPQGVNWAPTNHQAFSEVHNYSGDQLAGDTTAHTTFRDINWSDGSAWYGSGFGGTSNPYQAGTPQPSTYPDRGAAGFDALTYTDGSDFDTWDARCP